VLVRIDRETGKENWRVSVDTPYAATVVDDSGVIQTGWQEIVAVDHSGDVRWRRDLQSRASAGVAGSDIYVAADDLHELDASTGQTNWQAHLPDSATAAPVVTDTDVLVAAGDVRAFRRTVGDLFSTDRLRWRVISPCRGVFVASRRRWSHIRRGPVRPTGTPTRRGQLNRSGSAVLFGKIDLTVMVALFELYLVVQI